MSIDKCLERTFQEYVKRSQQNDKYNKGLRLRNAGENIDLVAAGLKFPSEYGLHIRLSQDLASLLKQYPYQAFAANYNAPKQIVDAKRQIDLLTLSVEPGETLLLGLQLDNNIEQGKEYFHQAALAVKNAHEHQKYSKVPGVFTIKPRPSKRDGPDYCTNKYESQDGWLNRFISVKEFIRENNFEPRFHIVHHGPIIPVTFDQLQKAFRSKIEITVLEIYHPDTGEDTQKKLQQVRQLLLNGDQASTRLQTHYS